MAEDQTDANTDTAAETVDTDVESAGSSPDVEEKEPIIDEDGFISTTEFKPVMKEETEEKVDEEVDTSDETEQKTETESKKDKPFHEHPDWQRMKNERDLAKQEKVALEKRLADLEKVESPGTEENQFTIDWANMNDDDLSDAFLESPKKFLTEFAELLKTDIKTTEQRQKAQLTQQEQEAKTKSAYESYFSKTEGALDMWKDGTIQKYMDENPGETPISAHRALTEETKIQKAVNAAIEKTAKETEARIYKTLKAKGIANSNATVPGSHSLKADESPEVKNPEKFGGARAVAAKRYLARLAG